MIHCFFFLKTSHQAFLYLVRKLAHILSFPPTIRRKKSWCCYALLFKIGISNERHEKQRFLHNLLGKKGEKKAVFFLKPAFYLSCFYARWDILAYQIFLTLLSFSLCAKCFNCFKDIRKTYNWVKIQLDQRNFIHCQFSSHACQKLIFWFKMHLSLVCSNKRIKVSYNFMKLLSTHSQSFAYCVK